MNKTVTHSPCVFDEKEFFQAKVCSCGVIHLYFGSTTINLSASALKFVAETLNEVVRDQRFIEQTDPVNGNEASLDDIGSVIRGYFPRTTH